MPQYTDFIFPSETRENADMIAKFALVLLAAGCSLAAQSKKPEDLAVGKILITPRNAPDAAFAESAILLVRYSEAGAVGLMLNLPTTVPVSRALREIKGAAGHSDPIFIGGPVEPGTVLTLARTPHKPDGGEDVFGNIYLIAARAGLEKALAGSTNPRGLRIYIGYCGWGPHQLEYEMSRGGWYIFDRSEDLAFDTAPETLWERLAAKTELRMARLGFSLSAGLAGPRP